MSERRARDWTEIRDEAIQSGRVTQEGIDAGKERLRARQRAYRLAEIRREHGLRQVDIATAMHVSQKRVSAVENGRLDRTEIGTVEAYVEALGGRVEIIADFGDQRVVVG